MANNWIASLQNDLNSGDVKLPETVAKAVDRLLFVLSDEQKTEIAATLEDALINLHFSLGMEIRNAFGLHDLGSKLMKVVGM